MGKRRDMRSRIVEEAHVRRDMHGKDGKRGRREKY
jgi:hypothetical protein